MAEILLQAISHSYAAHTPDYVLRDIELRWRDGGAYALLGPSGCGKTTLLGIISGLIRPSKGRVLYGGKDVTALPTRQRNIAQVFQFPVIYDTMSVYDNLAFPLRNRGLGNAEIDKRVRHIAEMLDLDKVLAERAIRLTADNKQIISLGRGLVRDDVAAILFDEPLTVIDPHRKWMLRRKLKEIHRQFKHTLIYVTHDQTEAMTFADEVVVMHEGAVLQQGTPEDLFARPAHTYVGYFIGSPGMNMLACRVDGSAGHALIAGHAVPVPAELARKAAMGAQEPGALMLGIRPEHVELVPEGQETSYTLPLQVTGVEDHGRFFIVSGVIVGAAAGQASGPGAPATSESRVVKIRASASAAAEPGRIIHIRFPAERICLYHDHRLIGGTESGSHASEANEVVHARDR